MISNRRTLLVIMIMIVVLLTTACVGADEQGTGLEQVSPTVFVTVYVTPVTATPIAVTPQPSPSPTMPIIPTYSDPNAPWNAPIYFPGPGCSGSRLHVDDRAFVASIGELARIFLSKNIPYDPGVRDLVLGEEMVITAGPTCDENWVLWKVKMDSDEIVGWVPEGNGEVYYLLPAQTAE
jgi:hypothetical protein